MFDLDMPDMPEDAAERIADFHELKKRKRNK